MIKIGKPLFESLARRRLLSKGELYPPRSNNEKLFHAQVASRVPLDMLPDWLERNEELFKKHTALEPREFAEATIRYNNSSPKERLIQSLLRASVAANVVTPRAAPWLMPSTMLVEDIIPMLKEMDALDAGLVLGAMAHLNFENSRVKIELCNIIARQANRSINANLSALTALTGMILDTSPSTTLSSEDMHQCEVMYSTIASKGQSILESFNLIQLAKFAHVLAPMVGKVDKVNRYMEDLTRVVLKLLNEQSQCDDADSAVDVDVDLDMDTLLKLVMNLQSTNIDVYQLLALKMYPRIHQLDVQELVLVVNCFTRFKLKVCRGENFVKLLVKVAEALAAKFECSSPSTKNVALIANAFSRAKILHEKLFNLLERHLVLNIADYDARQMAMVMHAYAKLGYKSDTLNFTWDRCIQILPQCDWQSIAMLIHAHCKLAPPSLEILQAFEKRAMDIVNEDPSCLVKHPTSAVTLLYTLVRAGALDVPLLLPLLETCNGYLKLLKPEELGSATVAASLVYNKCKDPECQPSNEHNIDKLKHASKRLLEAVCDLIYSNDFAVSEPPTLLKITSAMARAQTPMATLAVQRTCRRSVHVLDKMHLNQASQLLKSLATLGVSDPDVTAMLQRRKRLPTIN